jgi:hypothetical protein
LGEGDWKDDNGRKHLLTEEEQMYSATPVESGIVQEDHHLMHIKQLHTFQGEKGRTYGQAAGAVLPKLSVGQIDASKQMTQEQIHEVETLKADRNNLSAGPMKIPVGRNTIISRSAGGHKDQQPWLSLDTHTAVSINVTQVIPRSFHEKSVVKEIHKQLAESQGRTSPRFLASSNIFHAQAHSSSVLDGDTAGASTEISGHQQQPPPVHFGDTQGNKAMMLSHAHAAKSQQYVRELRANVEQNSKHGRRLLDDVMDGGQTNEPMQQQEGEAPTSFQPNIQVIEYWKHQVDMQRERESNKNIQAEMHEEARTDATFEARTDATFPVIGGALMFIGLFLLCGACAASKGQVCVCV